MLARANGNHAVASTAAYLAFKEIPIGDAFIADFNEKTAGYEWAKQAEKEAEDLDEHQEELQEEQKQEQQEQQAEAAEAEDSMQPMELA